MKLVFALFLALICVINAAPSPLCYPSTVVANGFAFVGYGQLGYKYSLPNLNVQKAFTYPIRDVALCAPGTFTDSTEDYLTWGNGPNNAASVNIAASDLRVLVKSANSAPLPSQSLWPNYSGCTSIVNGVKYCYENKQVVKREGASDSSSGTIADLIAVNDQGQYAPFIAIDPVSGHLHLATAYSTGIRGSSNYTFWTFSVSPLAVINQAELPWTASYGCPVEPAQCGVPVLIDFDIYDDVAVWLWSNAASGNLVVTIQSYDARCKKGYSVILDGRSSGDNTARCTSGGSCTGANCGGDVGLCSSQACCDAQATPNYQTGAGFLKYNESCKTGGTHCVGTSGCQLCFRGTSAQANEGNRPACGF